MDEPVHDVIDRVVDGRRVLVLAPRLVAPPFRVLTFLHGRGEAAGDEAGRPLGTSPEALIRRHGPPALAGHADHAPSGVDQAASEDDAGQVDHPLASFLVICPQRDRIGQWLDEDASWIGALEDRIIAEHDGDVRRRHLTGFSWGGAGVTRFAARRDFAGRWRSLWIVDPNPDPAVTPLPPAQCPAMLHFGTYFDADTMKAWRSEAGFDGTFETDAMRAESNLHLGHVETARDAYRDAAAYRFLSYWETRRAEVV